MASTLVNVNYYLPTYLATYLHTSDIQPLDMRSSNVEIFAVTSEFVNFQQNVDEVVPRYVRL